MAEEGTTRSWTRDKRAFCPRNNAGTAYSVTNCNVYSNLRVWWRESAKSSDNRRRRTLVLGYRAESRLALLLLPFFCKSATKNGVVRDVKTSSSGDCRGFTGLGTSLG